MGVLTYHSIKRRQQLIQANFSEFRQYADEIAFDSATDQTKSSNAQLLALFSLHQFKTVPADSLQSFFGDWNMLDWAIQYPALEENDGFPGSELLIPFFTIFPEMMYTQGEGETWEFVLAYPMADALNDLLMNLELDE
ncbi:hypothetical protein HDV00_011867 [Rhizophlyctis rosea]|nr:hypothetical protein HDV00_011867 [Rhizophlyctis rosea]